MLYVQINSGSFAVSLVHKIVSLPSLQNPLSRASLTSFSRCMSEMSSLLLVQGVELFPLTRNFPGLKVSAWQRLQNKEPAGYGRGHSAEL